MQNLIAQTKVFEGTPLRGFGELGLEGKIGMDSNIVFEKILSTTVGIITVIAGIWLIFTFITGGIAIMGAGGDKAALETAIIRIFSGLIGFVIVVVSLFIVDLIGKIFGLRLLYPTQFVIDTFLSS